MCEGFQSNLEHVHVLMSRVFECESHCLAITSFFLPCSQPEPINGSFSQLFFEYEKETLLRRISTLVGTNWSLNLVLSAQARCLSWKFWFVLNFFFFFINAVKYNILLWGP